MLKKILFSVIIFIIIITIGASWHFSSEIIFPKKWPCPADHFIYCGDPSELNLAFEEVSFPAGGDAEISAWYIPSGNSNKTIVMVHGHGANRNEAMRWVKALNRTGFNLLIPDLRGHGESTPSPVSMGYHEQRDVISAVDYLQEEKEINTAGVFGVSMGSAAGILAMSIDERIIAGVFEAGYSDLESILTDMARRDFGLPKYPMIPIVLKFFEWRTGSDAGEISPLKKISGISPRPVFIIHCEEDNYIPYSHGLKIFDSASEPKYFWTSPCKQHAQAWQGDPEKAELLVTDFFRKYL